MMKIDNCHVFVGVNFDTAGVQVAYHSHDGQPVMVKEMSLPDARRFQEALGNAIRVTEYLEGRKGAAERTEHTERTKDGNGERWWVRVWRWFRSRRV